jgi:FkbM family methyltransferase
MMHDNKLVELLRNEMHRRTGNEYYERELAEILQLSRILGDCKSFVDVGASLGPYTWAANLLLKGAEITAIEANPVLCRHLKEQWQDIKANGPDNSNNLNVINSALSDEIGTLDFYINRENYLNSYIGDVLASTDSEGTHERIELPALSLDHIFSENPPDFVKIDIEGAEWRALKGARKLLEKRKTRFLVEIHPWGDASKNIRPSDVFALMSDHDYTVKRLNQHWLFTPEVPSLVDRLKSKAFGFVLNHPSIRKFAKSVLIRH